MDRYKPTDDRILRYIKTFMVENGYTPTIREICNGVGFSSTNTVYDHFMKLVRLGYIEQFNDRYRVKGMKYVQVDDEGSTDMFCV